LLHEFRFAAVCQSGLRFSSLPGYWSEILGDTIDSAMNATLPTFRELSAVERLFNRIFGFLVGLGLGFSYNYLLEVRGRKSGKIYSTPIDLLELKGRRFLVA